MIFVMFYSVPFKLNQKWLSKNQIVLELFIKQNIKNLDQNYASLC